MKRRCILSCLISLVAVAAFAGGATEAGGSTAKFGIPTGDLSGRTLEVLYMVGGQRQMGDPIIEKLKKLYPGLTINIQYDHNAHEIMRSKVMAGNPPDIFDLNQGLYDYYGAISEGICMPLNELFEQPAVDTSKKIKDYIDLDMFTKGKVDGKYYLVPDAIYTSGLWYSGKLLKSCGIKPPETWAEFMSACEVLKSKNIYPFAYYGSFAHEYPLDYFFFPMLAAIDYQAYVDIQNLKEGAWKSAAVRKLVGRIEEMIKKGYIDPNSPTYDITCQVNFIKYTIGFIPCGSWLEAEMEGSWPGDFDLTYLPWSGSEKANGTNYTLQASVVSAVSAKSKNLDIVTEWYRYFLTDKETITAVVNMHKNGLALKNFSRDFGALLPKSVQGTWDALSSGNKPIVDLWTAWYKEAGTGFGDAFNALVAGKITGEEFMNRLDAQDTKLRKDSSITKYTY
jgi:N-acetylglucosamine transport system substrate-binding protein